MTPRTRRHFTRILLAAGGGGAFGVLGLGGLLGRQASAQTPAAREIELTAQRFQYTPNEIHVKAGEAVVLVCRSLDFVHGMNLPDYGMRADLMPGQLTRVPLAPKPAGVYEFLCDNFCGDGHEGMHGRIVVGT